MEQYRISLEEAETSVKEVRSEVNKLDLDKREVEMRESKAKKLAEQIGEKMKQ